jgi:putative endonuclease
VINKGWRKDLVAEEAKVVVFVEVKAKSGTAHGSPEEMLTPAKRRRMTLLALHYLKRRGWLRRPARFDVVAVDWKDSRAAAVRHYPNAFPANGGW